MLVALGADHAGFELKEAVKRTLDAQGVAWRDFGTSSAESVDYPDFAALVTAAVVAGEADRGILVCGSGVGMAIAANRVHGIRAAVINDVAGAALAREHNDLNVLSLAARRAVPAEVEGIVATFLQTPFAGGRHERRVHKLELIDPHSHDAKSS
ncbi:MAG: ribose 5-phosphate isomerase B [Acidobacteriota bacterium]